ncbi:MAG: hypothetical protein VXZ59_08450 [Cyanobacteriota bacterium]|nr:hypothetical protein [Cyanobacteriota bacterium]
MDLQACVVPSVLTQSSLASRSTRSDPFLHKILTLLMNLAAKQDRVESQLESCSERPGIGPHKGGHACSCALIQTTRNTSIGESHGSWLQRGGCSFNRMPISIASAQPIGAMINEGIHQPFRASACSLQAVGEQAIACTAHNGQPLQQSSGEIEER